MEEKETFYVNFSTLRKSYIEVKLFLEKYSFKKVENLDTLINKDLGFIGDDNFYLVNDFVQKYELDFSRFDYSKHFHSDLDLLNQFQVILRIIFLPLYFLFWLIKEFTLDLINFNRYLDKLINLFSSSKTEVIDMSFGDLVTSYITKEYSLKSDMKINCSQIL